LGWIHVNWLSYSSTITVSRQFTSHDYSDNYNVVMVPEVSFKYTTYGVTNNTKLLSLNVHQVADDYIVCNLPWFKRF